MAVPMPDARPQRRPGWRGRIGVIQPAPGLMLEAEWQLYMPEGVAFPVTRLPLQGGQPDHYAAMAALAPDAAATLANAAASVIVYACGIGSLYQGPAAERALMERLAAAAGGVRVLGMAAAAVSAIRHIGATRIALLTPYPDSVNALVERYLRDCGLQPAGTSSLPTQSAITAVDLLPEQTYEAARTAMRRFGEADLLWLPCSNVRSLGLIDAIEHATGRPMVSSTQALLWQALGAIGVSEPIGAAGRLWNHAAADA
jgi:maleate isomerase